MNKKLNLCLALFMALAVLVQYSFTPQALVAYGLENTNNTVQTEEAVSDDGQAADTQEATEPTTENVEAEESAEPTESTEGTDATEATKSAAEEESPAAAEKEDADKQAIKYPAAQFSETVDNVKVNITASEGALPEGTTAKIEDIGFFKMSKVKSAVKNEMGKKSTVVKAINITFYDQEGKEIEPKKDVSVTFASGEFKELDNAQVVHIKDNGKAERVTNSNVDGTKATFKSDDFSVYVVVEEVVPRLTVEFKDYQGNLIDSMIIKGSDTEAEVQEIIYDPGAGTLGEGQMFKGWTTDQQYTATSEMKAIEAVRSEAMAAADNLNADQTMTYYAAIFESHTITYQSDDASPVTVGTTSVIYPSYGTTHEAPCTVNMGYTVDDSHNFEGWMALDSDSQNHIKNYPAGATREGEGAEAVYYYENGTNITVTGDVTFTVKAPEGHWLIFDENGKGGKYNAPQFVLTDATTSKPCSDSAMTRYGYTFAGWYYFPDGVEPPAPDAHKSRDLTDALPFTFGSTIEKTTTIYAKWTPKEKAPYTVIFWTQNQERDGYEVADSYATDNGNVGQMIPYTVRENGDEDYVSGFGMKNNTAYPNNPQHPAQIDRGHFIGFCLTEASKNQRVEITPEGDAVLNLYYDRIAYNFKFYLYRDGTQRTRYDYGNNSGTGSDLDGLVSWHSNQTQHPDLAPSSGYTIQSETVGGRTYYYFVMQAYYGEDISTKWPTYDKITGANGRNAVSYVMMVGTKLKPRATNNGSGTVKGTITVLDENIIGASEKANGNYVIVRFPNSYNNWRYHIWFETVEGEDYTGKTVRTYNGKSYYQDTIMEVRSSNTNVSEQNEPNYPGFEFQVKRGDNNNHTAFSGSETAWQTGNNPTLYHINFIYNREKYKISYFDGSYFDGSNNLIQTHASNLLHESGEIGQGATISDGDRNYKPALPSGEEGYVFEGWFLDEGCTTPYTWGKMPVGGIKVYAKWRQIEYRAFLYTNVPSSDESLTWGSATQALSFRVPYDSKVSAPTGKRTGYKFLGWYTDPGFTQAFNSDAFVLNEETVTKPYDMTKTMTDPENRPWAGPWEDPSIPDATNSDLTGWDSDGDQKGDAPRYWITKKLDLYAKWSKVLDGADGIKVVYTADGYDLDGNKVTGSNPPTDSGMYIENSNVSAGAAATAPEGYAFDHWVVETWDKNSNKYVYDSSSVTKLPGETFAAKADDARVVEKADGSKTYTIQVMAIYKKIEEKTPTHIAWYSNYGTDNGGKGTLYRYDTKDAQGKDTLKINDAVDIYGLSEGETTPTRAGFTFEGWTKTKGGTTADFLIWNGSEYKTTAGKTATQVAADQKPNIEDIYAVWKEHKVTINYAVAEDSTGFGTVSPKSETVKVSTGTASGSTATPASGYVIDYWTCDDDATRIGVGQEHFTPSKNADGFYEAHTYYAHFKPAKATVTVHHYLKGTTTKVADDVTSSETVGTEIDPATIPAAEEFYPTYDGFSLTKSGTDPTTTVTVTAGGVEIKLYYTLPLTITAKTDHKTYDGTPLDGAYTISGELSSDTAAIKTALGTAPSITNVSESPKNYLTPSEQAAITGIPSYYVVAYTPGVLTIDPRTVTVSVADKTVEYNGSEQYGNTQYTFSNVVSGQTATITYTPSHGKIKKTYDNGSYNADSFKVVDGAGKDVTGNYTLGTQTKGKLTITDRTTPYEITVVANSNTGNVYDGTTKTASGFETLEFTIDGNKYTVSGLTTSDPSSKDVCDLTNAISGTAIVKDADNNDVTDQFEVKTKDGKLEITARTVTVSVTDKTVQYNGSEQYGNTQYTFSNVVDGQTATITYNPSHGKVKKTYDNGSYNADSFKVMDGANDVTKNYTLGTQTKGKLTITDRETPYEITVVANSNTGNVYDGTTKSASGFETLEFTIDGNKYTVSGLVTSDPSSKDVCDLTNAISGTAIVKDADNNDVTDQFEVKTKDGKLEITARTVTVSVTDKTVQYNGSEQKGNAQYTFSNVAAGQTATITYSPSYGKYASETPYDNGSYNADSFKVMDGANDVTKNYTLGTQTKGKLTITNRKTPYEITVVSNSNIGNVYDGTTKSASGFATLEFTIDGNKYTVSGLTTSDPSSKNVCDLVNAISGTAVVKDASGVDVTAQFTVNKTAGRLEITPKPVLIKAENKTKVFGTADPALTAIVTGLIGSDTIPYTLRRVSGEKVGTYDINVLLLRSSSNVTPSTRMGNYEVSVEKGIFTITDAPAPPTPTPTPTPTPNPGGGGNPGGGAPAGGGVVAAAPPAPAAPAVIADNPAPTTINDTPAPKAVTAYWALINLLCAIATALLSLIMLIRYFGKRKYEEEVTDPATGEVVTRDVDEQRKGLARIASLIPAIGGIIAFILTEDMSLPMTMVDKWTILMIVILAIQVGVGIFAKLRDNDDEEEEDEAMA